MEITVNETAKKSWNVPSPSQNTCFEQFDVFLGLPVKFTDLVRVDWLLETHVQLVQLGTVEQQVAVQDNETFTKFLKSVPTFMSNI